MATGILAHGRDTKFLVYFNSRKWVVLTRTWRIQEQATESAEGVNGEQRDRLQKITNFYRATFECFDDGSSQTIENLISNQANEDAELPDLPLSGGVTLTFRSVGTARRAYTMTDCSLGPLDMNEGGRAAPLMHNLSFRFRQFGAVPAV